jgi:hypothetical protein
MFETKSGIFLIAGLGFFFLAFLSNALVPILMYADLPEKSVEQLVDDDNASQGWRLISQFADLRERYPEAFKKAFPKASKDDQAATRDACVEALALGRNVYIAEGCWHCHSQFVRPVSNEAKRWGPVSESWEYQNELQRPVLFGTRRVGPDLSREGGVLRGNDWHAVHFYRPRMTSPESVMPDYPWLFDGAPDKPNERGIAIITYIQWLGTWLESYPYVRDQNWGLDSEEY